MVGHDRSILQGFRLEARAESDVSAAHVTILRMYSPQLLDHFEHPRNPGEVVNADATVQVENPACGDILKLSLKIKNGHIAEIGFLARGCVPAMACGSALTELVRGMTLEAACSLRREEIVQAVGGLPEASVHASHLAMDALAAVLKDVKQNNH
jgi:nitrogen fixation NifU-like protein